MALFPGTRLGPYLVAAQIGAGGMGEVYRARDERLGRDVALKSLPEAFTGDAQRMARFQREAQLLASLSHSNIATIHGLEVSGATRALVMELVEGPTLADRIAQGAIPMDEALPIAKQITEALEYAHERGIIHRDLKPANIKLTKEGAVKILDFGLAKALADDPATPDASNSPTLSVAATKAGFILGTAAYMSPEQAKGKSVDRRADIWSFGVVLYEMLTGQRLHSGETASETLAAVIKDEPDWSKLSSGTPLGIRELLRRCLTKDPRARLRDIGEARIVLQDALTQPQANVSLGEARPWAGEQGAAGVRVWRVALPWILSVVLAAIAGLAVWTSWRGKPAPAPVVRRFVVDLPRGQVFWGPQPWIAISPDGWHAAYLASRLDGPGWGLYVRRMDQLQASSIPEEDLNQPFFSPDGQWVGYFAGTKLKKVSIQGGAPVTLCDVTNPRGASWSEDGTIIFSPDGAGGLWKVSAAGGRPEALTQSAAVADRLSHRWPHVLPNGRAVLFTVSGLSGGSQYSAIAALSLKTGKIHTLLEGGSSPRYLASGHIVYGRAGTLYAVSFDVERLELTGTPVPVEEDVRMDVTTGAGYYDTSREGTLVYLSGSAPVDLNELVWVDRKGTEKTIPAQPRAYSNVRVSPDGNRVVARVADSNVDIWVYEVRRGALSRLTFQPEEDESPVWTPDGKRIAFSSSIAAKGRSIVWKNADGSGVEEVLWEGGTHTHVNSISPDQRWLAFTDYDAGTHGDLWVLPLQGERKPQPFHKTTFNEYDACFSPDGRWIAYTSDESGQNEIYVQAFPGSGGKWQVSAGGGEGPVWAPNGKELFYRDGGKMVTVSIATTPAFSAGAPRLLFEGSQIRNPRREANYDVSPDGQRFLMTKGSGIGSRAAQYQVALNWTEEMKRRARPSKK